MSEEKKTRQMTPKGFLAKMNTKAANSAVAFIQQYRKFLTTGEVAEVTSPIIAKVDSGELLPTPAMNEIGFAIMSHIIQVDAAKMDAKLNGESKGGRVSKPKNWVATVYDEKGVIQTRINAKGEVEDLIKGFDLGQDADRWAMRRLYEGASDWYAEVLHSFIPNVGSRIERSDAIAFIDKKPKGPAIHQKGKSTKSLGFGTKVGQTRVTFSHG